MDADKKLDDVEIVNPLDGVGGGVIEDTINK